MAIPGLKPELPLRAKVRVGAKDDRGNPTSLDHFVCDDDAFGALAGDKPKRLRIRFPYADHRECWSSGLEKWMKTRDGRPLLGCYTKGDGTAHRLGDERNADGDIILNPTIKGQPRNAMPCKGQECPYYGTDRDQGCRPVARLNFFLVGDPRVDSVYRLETKSLNTIEMIEAVVAQYADLRDGEWELVAERRKKGAKQFTVVSLQAVGQAPPVPTLVTPGPRQALKDFLVEQDWWPMTDEQVEWVRNVGPEAALEALKLRAERARA